MNSDFVGVFLIRELAKNPSDVRYSTLSLTVIGKINL